jgi:hypothetical protein
LNTFDDAFRFGFTPAGGYDLVEHDVIQDFKTRCVQSFEPDSKSATAVDELPKTFASEESQSGQNLNPTGAPAHFRGEIAGFACRTSLEIGCIDTKYVRLFQRAAIIQIGGNPGRPKTMTSDLGLDSGGQRAGRSSRKCRDVVVN